MQGFVSVGEVGVVGMGGIGADQETPRQCPPVTRRIGAQPQGDALQHVAQETPVRALVALAADFLVVEEGRHRGVLPVLHCQQRR